MKWEKIKQIHLCKTNIKNTLENIFLLLSICGIICLIGLLIYSIFAIAILTTLAVFFKIILCMIALTMIVTALYGTYLLLEFYEKI